MLGGFGGQLKVPGAIYISTYGATSACDGVTRRIIEGNSGIFVFRGVFLFIYFGTVTLNAVVTLPTTAPFSV